MEKPENLGVLDLATPEEIEKITLFAKEVAKTPYCPIRYMQRTADGKMYPRINYIVSTILYGRQVGLNAWNSLKSIAIVEGTPTLYGDALMTIVQKSGLLEKYEYRYEGNFGEDDYKAIVVLKRKGMISDVVTEFSVRDAKLAKLWLRKTKNGLDTPWSNYPNRMLLNRCRTYALREVFPDVLDGFSGTEELEDAFDVAEEQKNKLENADLCKNSIIPDEDYSPKF